MIQIVRLVVILICVSAFSLKAQTDSLRYGALERIITETRKQFAPDRRTEVLEVQLDTQRAVLSVESTSRAAFLYLKQQADNQNIGIVVQEQPLPSGELNGKIYGVANLSVSNNRFRPDHAAELVTQTLLGTPLEVLKKQGGYYLVRSPDRYISWMDAAGIVVMDEPEFSRWKQNTKIVFTSSVGRAYTRRDLKSLPVSDLVAGNILETRGKKKKFYQVTFPDGREAFVPAKEAMLYSEWVKRPNPQAEAIVHTAKRFMGLPYLWGGTSMKGVDCSGFTRSCFYLNGVILARDASQQALYGEPVDIQESGQVSIKKCLGNLKAGDLLFFAAKAPASGARITHTAIYLGKGEFIQSAGMVKVSSLIDTAVNFDPFHSRTLVSARRVLTSVGTEGISRIDQHSHYQTE